MFAFLSQSRVVAILFTAAVTLTLNACAHQQASDRTTWQSYQMHQTQADVAEQSYRRYPNAGSGFSPYEQHYSAFATGNAAGGTYQEQNSFTSGYYNSEASSSNFSAGHESGAGVYATGHSGPDATSSFESFSHTHVQSQ